MSRPKSIKPHLVKELIKERRGGVALKALSVRFDRDERTLRRYLEPHGLVRRRRTILVLLEQARGAQRLDLARRVLDLEEWLRLPRLERTIESLERIRGVPFHRQHARWFREAKSVGIALRRVEPVEGDAYYEADMDKAMRILSPIVVMAALRIKVAFEKRKGKR